jgi:hypothetical protein
MREPNFFIVGTLKAGTTSLHRYLDQHPDIYMSPMKEPCYFWLEMRPENWAPSQRARGYRSLAETQKYLRGPMDKQCSGGIVCEWDDYLKLFAAATTQRAVGEATVGYMVSKGAAAAIAARFPRAKLIMVLRSPAERAFSQYLHCRTVGATSAPFRDHVRACLRHGGEGIGIHQPFLEVGFYAAQVERYLDHFPRKQIGIWIYEETRKDPREFLRQVFRFLEVDDSFSPDMTTRHNEPRVPRLAATGKPLRWARMTEFSRRILPAPIRIALRDAVYRQPGSVAMDPADRALMLDFYRSDIHKLEGILGRDLGLWLG